MGMLEACNSTRLPRKAAAHIAVAGVVIMNDLNRHTSTEGRALTAFVYCSHSPYADGADNIIVTKLLPFQRQHPMHSSFRRQVPFALERCLCQQWALLLAIVRKLNCCPSELVSGYFFSHSPLTVFTTIVICFASFGSVVPPLSISIFALVSWSMPGSLLRIAWACALVFPLILASSFCLFASVHW